jgi:uncharacterized repeat protein (TIGR01451 family)
VSLPLPQITVEKEADMAVAEHVAGNTYKAEYTVTVTNIGDGPGQYDLSDLPAFGTGANVSSVVIDPAIVDDVNIDPHDAHEYTVTVTFTVDGSMPADERECALEPTPGQGAYNGVTVSFNDGGSDHDADCIDIPEPDVTRDKIIDPEHPLTRSLGGSWSIGYILTVHNASGAGPASYDIDDELSFGPGVDITGVTVTEDIPSVTPNPDFDGETDTNIASGVLINDGETHTYHVLLTLRITVVQGSNGDCNSEGGLSNSLIISVRGVEDEPVTVCSGFAMLSLHKALSESRHGGNATIDDFTLSASTDDSEGPSVSLLSGHSGISVAVPAGTYRLAEAAFPGYHFIGPGFLCSNEQSGFSVTLSLGDNVDCTITNEDVPVDLELTKDDGGFVGTAGVQTPFTYTITVANVGARELDDEPVTVVDDLPSAFEWVAPAPAGCVIEGQKLTCSVNPASLRPAGTTVTISATARLAAGAAAGTFDNRAYVTTQDDALITPPPCTDTGAIEANNNVDCESTPVNPLADMAIVKTASVPQVGAGGGFTWLLDVTNNGPSTATNVSVGDIVPGQVTVTGVTSTQFSCSNSGNTVTCTKPTMAVGETGVIAIAVTVPTTAVSGTVTNIGSVTATQPDSNLSNNSDDASVTIVAQAPPPPTPPPVVLPPTGSNSTSPLIRGAFVLVLLGGFVTLLSRRRRSTSAS